jgi:hypothetical protein
MYKMLKLKKGTEKKKKNINRHSEMPQRAPF